MKMKQKKENKEKKLKKFCPKCGSTNIVSTRLIAENVLADFKMHECNDCSWRGQPFEGTETFIQAFLEEKRKKKGKEKEIQEMEEEEMSKQEPEEKAEEEAYEE